MKRMIAIVLVSMFGFAFGCGGAQPEVAEPEQPEGEADVEEALAEEPAEEATEEAPAEETAEEAPAEEAEEAPAE